MILIDYSPVLISCAHSANSWQDEEDKAAALGRTTLNDSGATIGDVHVFRMLNTLRMVNSKYRRTHGKPVICMDRKPYWRNSSFTNYKKNRKPMDRSMDWKLFFDNGETIIDAAINVFGWRVMDIPGLEGDDIIGTLVHHFPDEKHIIISPDGDFKQLQTYKNVSQWDTIRKRMIVEKYPEQWLKEKIITGDKKDGIPNINSDKDIFCIDGGRQSPVRSADRKIWVGSDPMFWATQDQMERYKFNELMLDMSKLPEEHVAAVLGEMKNPTNRPGNLYGFFASKGITRFMDTLGDFT